MRLIDADKLKELLEKDFYDAEGLQDLFDNIDACPTAYDIDKVVERIKEYTYCMCEDKIFECDERCNNCPRYRIESEFIDIANLVRNGGKE